MLKGVFSKDLIFFSDFNCSVCSVNFPCFEKFIFL